MTRYQALVPREEVRGAVSDTVYPKGVQLAERCGFVQSTEVLLLQPWHTISCIELSLCPDLSTTSLKQIRAFGKLYRNAYI